MIFLRFLNTATIFLYASAQSVSALQKALAAHGIAAVYPADKDFSTVSQPYNRRFTISPLAVAFPTSVAQVSAAVAAGAAQNLEVVARSGGHSYIANGLGGFNSSALVVDLSKLKAITVQSSNNTAIIGNGNRLGDIALALNAAGRGIPHGTCPYVGIGGHSGYGGFGLTSRMWGLTLDTVKSATVVLGNGTIVSASPNVNSDLFWAIRGASPSFGIVTSIEVQTFKAPASATIFEYSWDSLDIPTAISALSTFQTFAATNLPSEFGAELVFGTGSSNKQVSVDWTGAWYGNTSALPALTAPFLKALPKPSSKTITPGTYINSVSILAQGQKLNTSSGPDVSDTFYAKSLMTPEDAPMSDAAIKVFVTYMANQGFSSHTDWFVEIGLFGGTNSAINSIPLDATAFAKRDTLLTMQFYASSKNGAPYPAAGYTFVDGMAASIVNNSPLNWNYGAYLNYADNRLSNAANLYYGSHYARLRSLKATWDPQNTFRFPVGID
ncbi:glucooligosaccharide oxidase [Mycena crocata]|nr:glucooligosaccharide oxidase [Mycena crocata]